MRLRLLHKLSLIIILLLVLAWSGRSACSQPSTEIVLKAIDYGYLVHVEYVPKPRYTHRELTASELARELLLKSFYGEELNQKYLSFLLKCRRNGYYASTPNGVEADFEATFYVSWLFKQIGLDPEVSPQLLYSTANSSIEFKKAYYAARTLKLLGYQVEKGLLKGFDLGYATSSLRGSKTPSIEATRLWLLLFNDESKVEWLRSKGVYVYPEASAYIYRDWIDIEQLLVYRPVYINATVFPRVVVEEVPRLVYARAVRWPSEELNYTFSWRIEGERIFSEVRAGGRVLVFRHVLGRRESTIVRLEQELGRLVIYCSYRPPYALRIFLAGTRYEWNVTAYEFTGGVKLPAYGVFKVSVEVEGENVFLKGSGVVELRAEYERRLLDYAFTVLPLLSVLASLAGSRRKRRLAFFSLLPPVLLFAFPSLVLEQHPLWLTLGCGFFTLLVTYLVDREAFSRALGHIAILTALSSTTVVLGNPIVLLLGGFGAVVFLASAILYPSELDKTERFYKSTMLLYSLGVLAMEALNEVAVTVASFLHSPSTGFIEAVRTQVMFASNLFALTPVIAPLYHLARLVHSYQRAEEARRVLEKLASRPKD